MGFILKDSPFFAYPFLTGEVWHFILSKFYSPQGVGKPLVSNLIIAQSRADRAISDNMAARGAEGPGIIDHL